MLQLYLSNQQFYCLILDVLRYPRTKNYTNGSHFVLFCCRFGAGNFTYILQGYFIGTKHEGYTGVLMPVKQAWRICANKQNLMHILADVLYVYTLAIARTK